MKTTCKVLIPVLLLFYFGACEKEEVCKLSVTVNVTDVNDSTKQLNSVATGGKEPYKYEWINDPWLRTTAAITASRFIDYGPSSSTYILQVKDRNDCIARDTVIVVWDSLKGNAGDPRFNLQFTNPDLVDLDLYVKTPNDSIISWDNKLSDGGALDVDCYCSGCPNGANENIYWVPGTAPSGTYSYWVEYYLSCDGSVSPSTYTIRFMKNDFTLETHTGSLAGGSSPVFTIDLP